MSKKGKTILPRTPPNFHPLNNISLKLYGKTFTHLTAKQEKAVLKRANKRYGKKAVRGMLIKQKIYRKNRRSGRVVRQRRKFERGIREERML